MIWSVCAGQQQCPDVSATNRHQHAFLQPTVRVTLYARVWDRYTTGKHGGGFPGYTARTGSMLFPYSISFLRRRCMLRYPYFWPILLCCLAEIVSVAGTAGIRSQNYWLSQVVFRICVALGVCFHGTECPPYSGFSQSPASWQF